MFYSRISPANAQIVEFALEYGHFGFTAGDLASLGYLNFDAVKGNQAPALYLYNDKYNHTEAGSPNPGLNGLSEFGTQGLGNIYEMDNLRGGDIAPVPAPASWVLLFSGALLGGLSFSRRRPSFLLRALGVLRGE